MPYMKKFVKIPDGFDMERAERRSFSCPNKLWEEILTKCYCICPVSIFIKQAIVEKLIKENPDQEEYYQDLLQLN